MLAFEGRLLRVFPGSRLVPCTDRHFSAGPARMRSLPVLFRHHGSCSLFCCVHYNSCALNCQYSPACRDNKNSGRPAASYSVHIHKNLPRSPAAGLHAPGSVRRARADKPSEFFLEHDWWIVRYERIEFGLDFPERVECHVESQDAGKCSFVIESQPFADRVCRYRNSFGLIV